MRARVLTPAGQPGPGSPIEVELEAEVRDGRLRLPGLEVLDVREPLPDCGELLFEPADGGGPLAGEHDDEEARWFGVVNTGYHVYRGLDWATRMLGRPLPPLLVRIGMHAGQRPGWAGGHYRLPAEGYSSLPELDEVAVSGEIHLGCGGSYLAYQGRRYFDAPSHNPGILVHELGHHICRHTADFRLNARRPPTRQANRKIPLEEGTCDYVAATLLGFPDIFGWHRGGVPRVHPGRRCLDVSRTMAEFRGGSRQDPHADGAVWAAALWTARTAVLHEGHPADTFDALLLDGLGRIGRSDPEVEWNEALRRRRHFGRALAAVLAATEEREPSLHDPIAGAFRRHGIEPGLSNRDLRDRMRHGGASPAGEVIAVAR